MGLIRDRVTHCQLLVKEYGLEIVYIKGVDICNQRVCSGIITMFNILTRTGWKRSYSSYYVMAWNMSTHKKHVKACRRCQLGKRHKRKYGHTPPKIAHTIPWNQGCVGLMGLYTTKAKDKLPWISCV